MWFRDLMTISLRQVVRHRRRYWGVALTIALGVAGFITVVTMGEDFKKNLNQDLELIGGATLIRVIFDNTLTSRPMWFQPGTIDALSRLPKVTYVTQVAVGMINAERGGVKYRLPAVAVDGQFWAARGFGAAKGRLFGAPEVSLRQRVCVLGSGIAKKVFGSDRAVGQFLQIGGEFYTVIGLVGGMHVRDLGHKMFLPFTTAQDRFPFFIGDRVYVRCASWDDVAGVAARIAGVVEANQAIENLNVQYSKMALEHLLRVAGWSEFFVYLTIVATLLLGGMGIWTVMMGAVRTRTREIGLKKSMGAQDGEILAQFLAEALILSLGAALVGSILGRIAVVATGSWIGTSPPEDLFFMCVAMAFGFALLLGAGAGLIPSLRASRMEVVTATRYE